MKITLIKKNKIQLDNPLKSRHIFIKSMLPLCCLMACSYPLFADLSVVMSATTTETIQGSAPYLTFDGGVTRSRNTDKFLDIELPDGSVFTKENNPSSPSNPIPLPSDGIKLGDIKTLIPPGQQAISMTDLLNNNGFWADKDGDGDITATGNLTIIGRDANNNEMHLNDAFLDCNAPYRITVQNDNSILSTAYGIPNSTSISFNSATYYLNPPKGACTYSVKPNLYLSDSRRRNWGGTNYSGPPNEWDDAKGFRRQDLNNPASNFPTMGAYALFFTMDMIDTLGSEMTYDKIPSTSGIDLNITGNGSIAKIKLVGPKEGASAAEAATAVPTTFILYSDRAKTNKVYSFTIQKWFIAIKANGGSYADAEQYCHNLGYQLPTINQLTNANSQYWNQGLAGQGNNYQRRIGGGLLAEWGETIDVDAPHGYPDSNFESNQVYWTQNTYQAERLYALSVYSNMGGVGIWQYGKTVCVN
ncbi:hypothetical protein GQ597_06745 [Gilliamella sp. Pra-s65]|uniref:hypothetical protein n=1 Tax=unclassified Gilliamella TaxID=2685620 RepID=UPI00136593EE|nr:MULTISPECIES: hypothetical protein [unclassified Gilliamella]MWN90393.1 hypothetical protein [Gilliamella sp. Pra-s65]MWP73335.1 hypothetical protein [Gilliamella sp. Pra-s52]